jgi:two-component system, response regulator PdtaR
VYSSSNDIVVPGRKPPFAMSKEIKKIVFVDDDRIQHLINRKNLVKIKPDLELIFFENPFSALDWMHHNKADLLILDVNMPEMCGWDFLQELSIKGNSTEVKILTSSMDPKDIEISMRYNQVTGFLIKPLKIKAIMEILGL